MLSQPSLVATDPSVQTSLHLLVYLDLLPYLASLASWSHTLLLKLSSIPALWLGLILASSATLCHSYLASKNTAYYQLPASASASCKTSSDSLYSAAAFFIQFVAIVIYYRYCIMYDMMYDLWVTITEIGIKELVLPI